MSDSPQPVAGIRIAGHPELLYVDMAADRVQAGERVSIHTSSGNLAGYVVIAADQVVAGQGDAETAVTGSLERREGELVVTLTTDPSESPARHIGAAADGPSQTGFESSIHELNREYETQAPRLGSRVETGHGAGVVVALDRERGVFVVELDSGATVEVDSKQH